MPEISEALTKILGKHPAAPFLFVGSGFSRRYLGLEDWQGLLAKFCVNIKSFGYYLSKADGDLPRTASYIADDFNEWWWNSEDCEQSRREFSAQVKSSSDALKFEIAKYIGTKNLGDAKLSESGSEVPHLAAINIDGIITTNWDFLLEELFPDYKVFVGQDELLFSNPQAIGEIYKIHGSADDPSSLILTEQDYTAFSNKNPYLAAKLVTIFVEHPIIFLGYSITDSHIREIIMSIARCLTQEKIAEFQDNLFFIQRVSGSQEPAIEKNTIQAGDLSITMTVVRVSDFSVVYNSLGAIKRKIPARLLRFFKEQMYELTRSPAENEKKLAVVNFDEIDNADEIEFVVGVGVAKRQEEFGEILEQRAQEALARKGYAGVSAEEVFLDCIQDQSRFAAVDLLETAYPVYARSHRTFIPVFRYLRAAGINSAEDLEASKYEGAKKIVRKLNDANYALPSYFSRYQRSFASFSTEEIINTASSSTEAVLMLCHQPRAKTDVARLRQFLVECADDLQAEPYRSSYKKLVCKYDRLAFGF